MEDLAQLLHNHYVNFPSLETQDAVKFLYQHYMGPGHLIDDEATALSRLKSEWDCVIPDPDAPLFHPLGNGLCRLNLNRCKADNLSVFTVAKIFILTARHFVPNKQSLEQNLELINSLPFSQDAVSEYLNQYRAQSCPMVSHSPRFRQQYHPAYRIILSRYVNILPALSAIDNALKEQPHLRVAIDGPCASGKSTLGKVLQEIYDCPLIHMDDFFLRPEQRTPERLAQPGGNVDYDRFAREVLSPLLANQLFSYRPWMCQRGSLGEEITVSPAPLTVVEGSYSLHPDLRDAYHLRIWVESRPEVRRQRLLERGGPECLERFEQLWIPLENRYFSACSVADVCHVHLDLS